MRSAARKGIGLLRNPLKSISYTPAFLESPKQSIIALCLGLLAAGAIILPASAPAHAKELYGLAMHGDAKYTPEDTHLGYANPDAPQGGTLKMAAIGTFDTLNPYSIKGKAAQGLNLVYDRLMARVWDEPFTMYPLIAERVDIPEDRSAITVHINPKARFHDASPITADDVIFSFETLRDEGRPNMRRIYRLVESIEKRGDLSVHFELGEGFDKETVMIIAMMPVLSQSFWDGRTFDQTILDIPNTNGAYRIKEFEPGRRIVYERVKDYWANDLLTSSGHFNFDEIVYDYYRDDTVAFEAFKAGEYDLRREYDAGQWASAYDFPALKEGKVKADAIAHQRPERVRAFIFNTRRAPFDDIRVREALSLLFDFEWVNKNLFYGQYSRINSYFPNSELAATGKPSAEELQVLAPWMDDLDSAVFETPVDDLLPSGNIRRNMRKADALLREAGWSVEDGMRVKDGKPFTFSIILSAPEDEKIALHYKRALDKMGIKANIRVLDSAAFRGRLNEYDFDMTLYYWNSSLSPGTEQMLYWSCEAAQQPARWNFAGVCNPAVDAIAAAIADTKTRESLVAHAKALDRILLHGRYIVPLYYAGEDYMAYWLPLAHPEEAPLYGTVLETWWMNEDKGANGH